MPVDIGMINGMILDRFGNAKECRFMAFLAPTNRVPLIIGIKDLLENFNLNFKMKNEKCFIELKDS